MIDADSDGARRRARAFLAEAQQRTNEALDAYLPREGFGAPRLAEAMRYSLFAGGKRLRPALALAACRAAGGHDEQVLPFACALECVHTYSLIHDDLPAMDDDDWRRGQLTSHKQFGEALAILAGDALHTLAFELVLRHVEDPALARRLALELAAAIGHDGMVGGQVDDMAGTDAAPELGRLQRIHARKTGALIRVAVEGGGRAGGAGEPLVAALRAYGEAIGLAFQITDDILDVVGTKAALGKTPGKDAAADKITYVALEGLDGARTRADEALTTALDALAPMRASRPEGVGLLEDLARYVNARSH